MKIITALNNPSINIKLRKENKYEVVGKDIQYKDAILETLEKDKNINIIIINNEIPGEIELEKLVTIIKKINKKIKIIILLKNKENEKLKKLEKIGVKYAYIIKKINYYNLVNLLDSIENKANSQKNIINKKESNDNKITLIYGKKIKNKKVIITLLLKQLEKKYKNIMIINIKNKKNYNYNKSEILKNKKININNKINNNLKIIDYYPNNYILKKYEKDLEINKILYEGKKYFDFIIIQVENMKDENFYKEILKNVKNILIFMESDLSGVREVKKIIEDFKTDFLKFNIAINIIESNIKIYPISTKIIKQIFGISLHKFSFNLFKNYKEKSSYFNIFIKIKIKILLFYLSKNIYAKINRKKERRNLYGTK